MDHATKKMSPPPKKSPSLNVQRWQAPLLCLMLAAITFAVFGQTLRHEFINLDDDLYVYDNAKVASGLSLNGLAWVFTHADCYLYHPLTILSLMADYQLHGLHAGGYHFTNVLLHTSSVLLLFLILREMTGALWRSAFVAAVFAIHPLRVESVAWVAERKDVLAGFFFMLTLGAYVRYVRKPNSPARYLMVAAAFVLALLSKPTVVTLPFVLLLLDYWPLQRFEEPELAKNRKYFRIPGRLILEKMPLLALAAGACAMTVLAAGEGIAARATVSMPSRLGNALISYVVYLRQMIWPEGLAIFYPQPEKGYPVWTIALSFLLLALITGGVLAFRRKRRWLLAGWLWYLGMLTPMIGIVQAGAFAQADRMTYLPQIGLYLLLTWAAAEMSAAWRCRRLLLGGLAAIILVALIFCARTQAAYWRDSGTVFSHAVAVTDNSYVARKALGDFYCSRGMLEKAMALYREALKMCPNFEGAHMNLGAVLNQTGHPNEAIEEMKRAIQLKPDDASAYNNLGAILGDERLDESIALFQKAIELSPGYVDAHKNLGQSMDRKGRIEEAVAQYQEALRFSPDPDARYLLGLDLEKLGRCKEAIIQLTEALRYRPDNAPAQQALERLKKRNGN